MTIRRPTDYLRISAKQQQQKTAKLNGTAKFM